MSREAKILTAILVVVVGGMIALFVAAGGTDTSSPGSKADTSKLVHQDSHKRDNGSVTIVEFGDYQCPACGAAEPNLEKIQQDYKGKINFVFRNYPLPMHQNAVPAALAAEAAAAQGKFWEMHDKLYATQNEWSSSTSPIDFFTKYAQDLGLDADKLKQDVTNKTYQNRIDADKSDGNAVNIQATPTIFVNGEKASGYDYNSLKDLVEKAVNSKQ
jgi:protein-disulfide isomerase